MENILQKTIEERVSFIKHFDIIVSDNARIKDNYLISFADVSLRTEFYITDRDNVKIDLIALLTNTELAAYIKLVKAWEIKS
ncbi:hypothetical protein [Mucilaginibacter sp.]|uniref:hypothetical protein n=1 Tax=Mucilaginibacter sp. TaxID=1882438 RepID=UPI003D139236